MWLLPVYPSIHPSIHVCIHPSIYPSILLTIYLFFLFLPSSLPLFLLSFPVFHPPILLPGLPRFLPMQETKEMWVRSLGQEDSPGGGHGDSLQYSCLENLMDRWAWRATVHGVTMSLTWLKQLSTAHSMSFKLTRSSHCIPLHLPSDSHPSQESFLAFCFYTLHPI